MLTKIIKNPTHFKSVPLKTSQFLGSQRWSLYTWSTTVYCVSKIELTTKTKINHIFLSVSDRAAGNYRDRKLTCLGWVRMSERPGSGTGCWTRPSTTRTAGNTEWESSDDWPQRVGERPGDLPSRTGNGNSEEILAIIGPTSPTGWRSSRSSSSSYRSSPTASDPWASTFTKRPAWWESGFNRFRFLIVSVSNFLRFLKGVSISNLLRFLKGDSISSLIRFQAILGFKHSSVSSGFRFFVSRVQRGSG